MQLIKNLIYKYRMRKNPAILLRELGAKIGENCEIYPTANFIDPYLIKIGNNVRINEGVQLITHDGGVWVLRNLYSKLKDIDLFGKIVIGNNVHIGTNAVIMPGVKIGNNCIIGVSAVVTKNVPDNSVVVGIPAKVIKNIDEYREKNEAAFIYSKNIPVEKKREFVLKHINNRKKM